MGEGYNFQKLSDEIVSRSVSDDWLQAKLEWDLEYVYEYPPHKTCLCGHHPIENICVIRNDINRTRAEVGNVCVHKFLGMQSKRVFAALRRVRADISKSLNPRSIEMFMGLRVVSAQDADLYLEFWRKRKHVTPDQMKLRLRVNTAVLAYVDKRNAG
ncbi:hypothetical protein [Brevundimonas sp.]|uniref:hypothetical protein n=1 Tax=Brevundimonas sp. TaxID=1871086 RepID=UPI002FC758D3